MAFLFVIFQSWNKSAMIKPLFDYISSTNIIRLILQISIVRSKVTYIVREEMRNKSNYLT